MAIILELQFFQAEREMFLGDAVLLDEVPGGLMACMVVFLNTIFKSPCSLSK
jgi:hypothetical protein